MSYLHQFSGFPFGGALENMKGFAAGNSSAGGSATNQLLVARAAWLSGHASGYSHSIQLVITGGAITDINEQIPTQSINRSWLPSHASSDDVTADDWQTIVAVP